MSGHNGSLRAVIFALGSNLLITVIKFVVSAITRSAGMMAEAIHSLADCGNQIFLLIGSKRAIKKPTELHPFGYGKEEYFWGFLVAVLLFFVGAAFSIYEGIHKILEPSVLQNVGWSFAVLLVSILIEGKSFHVAYASFKSGSTGKSMIRALQDATDTNLLVILLEDSAALIGLVIVLVSTALAWFVHPVFDAIGSILVGTLLITVSLFMINELRKLIVGENIPAGLREEFRQIVLANPAIHSVKSISAMLLGRSRFLLVIAIDLEDQVEASLVEDNLEKIKRALNERSSFIHGIYFDIQDEVRSGK
ncbi:MAG: cation diffusion facilitator family transporter [Marinilabiliales bacterium]|nr:cation diffusion facilitator family transporter [Marinilabiliales bacterium]